ncbi:MAG: hypothetical protein AAGI91_05795 [Bacteroidota bacterium]
MPHLLPLCLALLVALPAAAQVDADLTRSYLDASNLPDQVSNIGDQIGQQIELQASQFPEPVQEPFLEIYGDALSAEALEERLSTFVMAKPDADSVEAAVAWYGEPLVGQLQALEDSMANDDEAQVAVQMYAMTGSFATVEVTPEREALVNRVLDATGGVDGTVELFLDIIVASQQSTASISRGDAPPADSIRAQMRPMLEGNLGSAVRGSTLYAYRDVPDEDLDAYLAHIQTPTGQYVARLYREAISAALVGAITDAGEAFAETLADLDAAGEIDLDEMLSGGEEEAEMEEDAEMEDETDSDG